MTQSINKIAFQGHAGAYSDQACKKVYPGIETLPCSSFEDAFLAVSNEEAEIAMIPVDNTIAGRVADVHHLLPNSKLYIIGEHFESIKHALLGVKGTKVEDIKNVHSHVHALPQCRKLIKKHSLKQFVEADTAGAAAEVARLNDPAHAAIASDLAAEIYDLEVLIDNVQDSEHNTTRFLVLSKEYQVPPNTPSETTLTSFVFRVRNIPAALYKALGGFATNGLSLAKLESYVDKKMQVAQFYCEVEGHPESRELQLALEELGFFADHFDLLGSFNAHPFRKKDP